MRRSLSPPTWEDYGFGPASACRAGRYGSDNGNETMSLEIIIFKLKNDGKKWSRIHFEIDRAPSELLLPRAKISAQNGRIGLAA